MRYITVNADYMGTGLKDNFKGSISSDDLDLPLVLKAEISSWNTAYQPIVLMNDNVRSSNAELIKTLDDQGLSITRKIKDFLGDGYKIDYYSEGLFRRIVA